MNDIKIGNYMHIDRFERAGTSIDFLLGFSILIVTWAYSIIWIQNLTGTETLISCTNTLTALQVISQLSDSPGVPSNWEKIGSIEVYGLHDPVESGNVLDPEKIDSFFSSPELDKKAFARLTSGRRMNISLLVEGETTDLSTGPPVPKDSTKVTRIVSIPSPHHGTVDSLLYLGDSPSLKFQINLTPDSKKNSPDLRPGDKVTLAGLADARINPDLPVKVLNVTYFDRAVSTPVDVVLDNSVVKAGIPFTADDSITLTIPDTGSNERGEFDLAFADGLTRLHGTAHVQEYLKSPGILSLEVW